jgi:hypothetical protein
MSRIIIAFRLSEIWQRNYYEHAVRNDDEIAESFRIAACARTTTGVLNGKEE